MAAPPFPPFASPADLAAARAFFAGHDDAHALFHRVVEAAAAAGPFQLTATTSRVSLTARTRFAWCHGANDDGAIWLGFLLPNRVESPRLRSGRAGGRWSHHVKVAGPPDLDAELAGWLREAHAWDVAGIKDAKAKVPKASKPSRTHPRKALNPLKRGSVPSVGSVGSVDGPGKRGSKAVGKDTTMSWTCPRCGQRFARKGQSHSCDRRAVEELFADYPKAVKATQLVKAHLDTLGEVRMAATKTQVSFAARRRFAWVWVPRQAARSGPADPVVSFLLPRREGDRRVREAVEARAGLWTHHVLVTSGRQVDARLKGWLAEAYGTVGAAP